MAEQKFEEQKSKGWVYTGKNSKGEIKFRKYTKQDLDYVKKYLDDKGLAYYVHEKTKLIFIYKDPEPKSQYSARYAYYYTTGMWGSDTRQKHYHSNGIEDFIDRFFKTSEESKRYWDEKNKKEKT